MNRHNFALCSWPNIEQKVCAHADTTREQMNKMSDGFGIAILRVVAPVVVDGHANFEREIIDRSWVKACCIETGQVLFESLNILTRQRLSMSIVEHHGIRLQGVN